MDVPTDNPESPNPPLVSEAENLSSASVRQQVFSIIFRRYAMFYDKAVYKLLRRFIEFSFLVKAFLALSILIYLHFAYVSNPSTSNCLADIGTPWNEPTILRIEVNRLPFVPDAGGEDIALPLKEILDPSKFQDAGSDDNDDGYEDNSVCRLSEGETLKNFSSIGDSVEAPVPIETKFYWPAGEVFVVDWFNGISTMPILMSDWLTALDLQIDLLADKISKMFTLVSKTENLLVEYSELDGLLLLSEQARKNLNVKVIHISLDPDTNQCFSRNLYRRAFSEEFLGFKDIVTLSLENFLISNKRTQGFYKIVGSEHVIPLKTERAASIIHCIIASLSMLVFVVLSSTIVQHGYYSVTAALVEVLYVPHRLRTFPACQVFMIFLALLGLHTAMDYLFRDDFTFWLHLFAIWVATQFHLICCHSEVSKRHWLKFFHLYHFVFYMYYFRFNGRFTILTMITCWMFIQHSMVYFFNHYELPYLYGLVRITQTLSELRRNNGNYRVRRRPNEIRLYVGRSATATGSNQSPRNSSTTNSRASVARGPTNFTRVRLSLSLPTL